MADSDITVTSLTATGGVGVIVVAPITGGQSCLPYLQLAAVEIWESASNNRAGAAYIGDAIAGFTRQGLAASATRYYWARARDVSGNLGDWFPASATGGRQASTSSTEVPDGSITENKIAPGAVTTTKIGNAQIVNAHLGNAIVATANIGDLAVTNAKISSISANKITTGTLIAGIVYSGTINTNQLNAGTLTGHTFQTAESGNRRVVISATGHSIEVLALNGQTRIGYSAVSSGIEVSSWGNYPAASFIGDSGSGNSGTVTVQNTQYAPVGGTALAVFSRGEGTLGHALRAYTRLLDGPSTSNGGQAIVAASPNSGGHAFIAEKGGYAPFTGVHDAFVSKDEATDIGDIVCDLKVIARNGVDDTVTEVYVAEDDADPNAVGVVSRRAAFESSSLMPAVPGGDTSTPLRKILAERYDRLAINSVGEGQVNVCGRGGDIRAGDLIMTSTLRGKGQRQPDGIVRNFTVAKAREDVTFSGPDDWKRVSCIYHCG